MDNLEVTRAEKLRLLLREFYQDLSEKSKFMASHRDTCALVAMTPVEPPADVMSIIAEQVEIDMQYMVKISQLMQRAFSSNDENLEEIRDQYLDLLKENNRLNDEITARAKEMLADSGMQQILQLLKKPANPDSLN